MNQTDHKLKVLISGGGTGGHIFPAVSIADAVKALRPDAEFLFVGAEGRMEMEKVPQAGYRIVGLPVRGFRRPLWHPANVMVLVDLWRSIRRARRLIGQFGPDVAVGVGGYASAAALKAAAALGVPYVLQEQNGFAGVTNRRLAQGARRICVAYPGMERFFPADRIVLTGNPVRQSLLQCTASVAEARVALGLEPDRPTLFVTGGSLGARSINRVILSHLRDLHEAGVQVLWQTGKADGTLWADGVKAFADGLGPGERCHVRATTFVTDMAMAYRAADVVITRSGAGAAAEVCLIGKAAIFVPLPTAAEDHQTANARSLADRGAALLVADSEAPDRLVAEALALVADPQRIARMEHAARALAQPEAARIIAQIVIQEAHP